MLTSTNPKWPKRKLTLITWRHLDKSEDYEHYFESDEEIEIFVQKVFEQKESGYVTITYENGEVREYHGRI